MGRRTGGRVYNVARTTHLQGCVVEAVSDTWVAVESKVRGRGVQVTRVCVSIQPVS